MLLRLLSESLMRFGRVDSVEADFVLGGRSWQRARCPLSQWCGVRNGRDARCPSGVEDCERVAVSNAHDATRNLPREEGEREHQEQYQHPQRHQPSPFATAWDHAALPAHQRIELWISLGKQNACLVYLSLLEALACPCVKEKTRSRETVQTARATPSNSVHTYRTFVRLKPPSFQ